jgi:hypothetical protein
MMPAVLGHDILLVLFAEKMTTLDIACSMKEVIVKPLLDQALNDSENKCGRDAEH